MKRKILFVNDEMTLGGVSRILNTLLANLDPKKYDVDLLVLHPHGALMKEIPDWVHVLPSDRAFEFVDQSFIELWRTRQYTGMIKKGLFFLSMKTRRIIPIIQRERKRLLNRSYDVEFSAKEGFCTIFTAYGETPYKINWVQTDYKEENYAKRHMRLFADALKRINIHIACSQGVADSFREVFDIENIKVIHNLIDEDRIRELASSPITFDFFEQDALNLIAVARFHPQKGLDRLIKAVCEVKKYGFNVKLALIGDGLLMPDLIALTKSFNLEDDVRFLGYQLNPYPFIKKADLFVLSSHYEGYPTIVIESLLSATPVLAMDVAGIKDQITKSHDGWIVANEQTALNETLIRLAEQKSLLSDMKTSLSGYHYENEKLLQEICYYMDDHS